MARVVLDEVIQPGNGRAIAVAKGSHMRIEQTEGGEVADVICLAADQVDERLSCSNTIMYNLNLNLPQGSSIFSNRSRRMLKMVEDTVKSHNLFLGCCTLESFKHRWNLDYHKSCHETFQACLAELGLPNQEIPPPVNFFMNWPFQADGTLEMGSSPAVAGDYVELEAEMDIIFVLSVCAQELTPTNNFRPTALRLRIEDPPS